MTADTAAPFAPHAWEGFYVIVGTAAGALVGLQFVVLTLIAESGRLRGTSDTLAAFASPNVVHFCTALLVSAFSIAPWHGPGPLGVATIVTGVCGLFYSIAVLRRASRQRDYRPVLEDWIWHAVLPIVAYAALVYAGIQLSHAIADALFIVGGASLLLVFIGIHNAWDTVTYVMVERVRTHERKAGAAAARPSAPEVATPPGEDAALPGPPPAAVP